jgi:two-component system response regulator YesN
MLYKLVIIDDEALIRESIPNIINWESMGFEIVASLEDGREAIEYIDKMHVDVVFTDIKMTFVSGLELAKYIYEHKPHIKVIIISGYQDFEFARQAISYDVVHYLLKPTRLDELRSIFEDVRNQLDKEKEERAKNEKISRDLQHYENLIPLLQEQFFADIILGALRNEDEIKRRIELVDLDIEPDHSKCCILEISFPNYKEYINNRWKYGKEVFYPALKNFFNVAKDGIVYFAAGLILDRVFVLANAPSEMDDTELTGTIKSCYEMIKTELKSQLNLDINYEIHGTFHNIFDAAMNFMPVTFSNENEGILENADELIQKSDWLVEQQKLFISYISAGNIESVSSLFDSFIEELKFVDFRTVQNFIIDLFLKISNKLTDIGVDINVITRNRFYYNIILTFKDIHEIRTWGRSILKEIAEYIGHSSESNGNKVIQKAKEYIRDHCCEDISLKDAADYVFLNSNYLCRLFKQQTGENFTDYLIRERMDKALKLLQDGQYKVYEICSMVGYKSNKYFVRLFKQHTGYTPSEYRKR